MDNSYLSNLTVPINSRASRDNNVVLPKIKPFGDAPNPQRVLYKKLVSMDKTKPNFLNDREFKQSLKSQLHHYNQFGQNEAMKYYVSHYKSSKAEHFGTEEVPQSSERLYGSVTTAKKANKSRLGLVMKNRNKSSKVLPDID